MIGIKHNPDRACVKQNPSDFAGIGKTRIVSSAQFSSQVAQNRAKPKLEMP
jgi:hypothetical protein